MYLVIIFLSSQCFHGACGTGLWGIRKGWQHPTAVQTYRSQAVPLYTLIYTRPRYLPVSKEWINTRLREKGCTGKNEVGKHDICQCSPMICYLLFLLEGDVLVTVRSKQPVHSSYYSHHYECIVTARVVPLGAQEDLQERKASKAVMSFRQDPSSSVQAEPWSGKRTKSCAISECILAGWLLSKCRL